MTLSLAAIALAVMPQIRAADSPSASPQPPAWRYVLPAPGDPFEHAPFRALVLSREKPEDLIEKAIYRGDPSRRRYAQLRFGSPSSTRAAIVVDVLASGDVDLYVDADRNRKIDDRDRVSLSAPGSGPRRERIWRLRLAVEIVEQDKVRAVPRSVVFRLGASGQTLGYAAAGYLEGKVTLGGTSRIREGEAKREAEAPSEPARPAPRPPEVEKDKDSHKPARSLAARRVDGDGNGLLADAQDRLWIDLNGDGAFDPASEQFLYSSVLNLGGSRYVVLSDELGSRLAFEPLEGTGTLRLALKASPAALEARAVELQATAIGRDGSVFGLTASEPATVPAGEYRLGTVTVSLDDPKGSRRWSYVFADAMAQGPPRWHKVEKDSAVVIDPIGTPSFAIKLRDQASQAKPGDEVFLQPALYTGDGLLIVVAYCGNPISPAFQEILGARIALLATDGKAMATAHSGFS